MKTPDVVVVGSATRDLNDDEAEPREWLLGGGVTFGALALARLGLRTGVVLGLDAEAATAPELELIRDAGAEIVAVPLEHGPVFTNIETLSGRIQICGGISDPVPADVLPEAWRRAPAWVFAPIASEIPDEWATVPTPEACVAFAWQGILRDLRPGEQVRHTRPVGSPFLSRADIVAVSRHDLPSDMAIADIGALLGSSTDLLLTAGLLGGMIIRFRDGAAAGSRAYPSVPSIEEVDAAGAGDTMLAGVVAARIALGDEASKAGRDLRMGATASSLLVEGPGMNSVPSFGRLMGRLSGRL